MSSASSMAACPSAGAFDAAREDVDARKSRALVDDDVTSEAYSSDVSLPLHFFSTSLTRNFPRIPPPSFPLAWSNAPCFQK